MKIKLLTLAVIVALAFSIAQAQAETCEGGKLVTGNNGHEYCQSNSKMNWWSAYTWCEAQGRHLATMYEVCPTWDGAKGHGKICNLNSFSNGEGEYNWSSTAFESNYAFSFTKTYVENIGSPRDNIIHCRALCY